MILKALLAIMAGRDVPLLHSDAFHEQKNIRAAALAGHARMIRLSHNADQAYARGDTDGVRQAMDRQSETRAALDDLSRRLG